MQANCRSAVNFGLAKIRIKPRILSGCKPRAAKGHYVLNCNPMTAKEFRQHLDRLGLTQAAFARLIKVNPKTVRRWASLTDPFETSRRDPAAPAVKDQGQGVARRGGLIAVAWLEARRLQ